VLVEFVVLSGLIRWSQIMRTPKMPIIYSSRHIYHSPKLCFYSGFLEPYAETPDRIETIKHHLHGVDFVKLIEPDSPVSAQKIAQTHHPALISFLREISVEAEEFLRREFTRLRKTHYLQDENYIYPDVFPVRPPMARIQDSPSGCLGYYSFDNAAPIGRGTWDAALHSATLAIMGANMLLESQSSVAYALCRPPGHHAGYDFIGGYCYFNNAAIAANHLLPVGKVAILDIDYHHGNGTQALFWDNPNVLFGSIHAHPDYEYPFYSGYPDEIGGAKAPNSNINIPLLEGAGRNEFMPALYELLNRIVDFKPTWLVVSMGFDTFAEDSQGLFKLTYDDYYEIGQQIAALNMPVLYIQEGGYNVDALGVLIERLIKGALHLV
jgi:acetoin utilization deacetylase AcuC-like enzyme